jgi:hypothetical protein
LLRSLEVLSFEQLWNEHRIVLIYDAYLNPYLLSADEEAKAVADAWVTAWKARQSSKFLVS